MNPFPAEGELPLPLGLLEFTPPNLDEPLDARKLQQAGAFLEDNRFPLVTQGFFVTLVRGPDGLWRLGEM